MSRILITGSADGLGMLAAILLTEAGHEVILHARDKHRANEAMVSVPGAAGAVVGDLSSIEQTRDVAAQINSLGTFDAIIHNAAIGYREPERIQTVDGLPHVFAVNSLAPYILTCLVAPPKRLVYMSSELHQQGDATLHDLAWEQRPWNGYQAYADSKLHNVLLAFAVARLWPGTCSNAVHPGWVPTKMGGANAPDSLDQAPRTQAWLASGKDPKALVSGKYFYHQQAQDAHAAALDTDTQDHYLMACAEFSGLELARP